MIYLRSKRIVAFFLAVFLFFVLEGVVSLDEIFFKFFFRIFPERHERSTTQETAMLYQKIGDLEKKIFEKETLEKSISANIIFGGGYLFANSIILDKGFSDGVEKGDFVIYQSSIVVAKIEEVFSGYSKAAPFSRFGEKIILRSGPGKNVVFEAKGKGGKEISASLPKGSRVNVGDVAYLAGNPRFLVGIVDMAEKKESRDFEELSIMLPFSLRSLERLDIFKNNVEEQ
jgi:cell shape-determining protein MreC